jgi:acyl-CoA reductase-like NAD-dependent aldehyde dehydrogenase
LSRIYKMFINGQWVESSSAETIVSYNPATEEPLAVIQQANQVDVDKAVNAAYDCFHSSQWQSLTYKDRADILREIGAVIEEKCVSLAKTECEENGKPIKECSLIDIPQAAETFKTFASMVLEMKGETYPTDGETFSYTVYEPMGVIAQILPWNYPLMIAAWKMAPALAAGNTVVIKPSEYTSTSLLELARLLKRTSLPDGAVNIITGTGLSAGKPLAEHRLISKISFTGSTRTGQEIIRSTSENIVPTALELGGKSATIVFNDSEKEKTVNGILSTIFMNQGQMCTAGSRLLIQQEVYNEYLALIKDKVKKFKIGNGINPDTHMGPLISGTHLLKVSTMVDNALNDGALCELGRENFELPCKGFFFAPTILTGVTSSMDIWNNEVFGPVLLVASFTNEEEAVRLANESTYGLSVSIWTENISRVHHLRRSINAGTVWINTYGSFSNEVSFGGFKKSGFGKELGLDSLLSYCRKKSITMDTTCEKKPLVSRWYGL